MQPSREQSIRSKLGSILGIGSSRTTSAPQRNLEDLGKLEHSTFFTADFLRVKIIHTDITQHCDKTKCYDDNTGTRQ